MNKARELISASIGLFLVGLGIYVLNNYLGSLMLALSTLLLGLTVIALVISKAWQVSMLYFTNIKSSHSTDIKDVISVIRS